MPISKEDLLKFGMKETNDDEKHFFPMKKTISQPSGEGGELAICVTTQNNTPELVLATPDGYLYIGATSIEELGAFEKCILSWESIH